MTGPRKFRTRPVEIEALLYDGGNEAEVMRWVGEHGFVDDDVQVFIRTLEGDLRAAPGDWIIRGLKGEFYPCKPDAFALKYGGVRPMSKATERPWRMSEDGEYVYSEASDRVVCDAPVRPPVTEEDEANLDLIVRAVNAHEEAIGLLREALRELECVDEAPFGHRCNRCDSEVDPNETVRAKARALLSRLDAGEGTP